MTLSTSSFDMLRMVHEVQEHINPLIKDKRLKFICRIPPDLKTNEADKEKVISCLVNLLGNAIKFTEEGEVVLRGQGCFRVAAGDLREQDVGRGQQVNLLAAIGVVEAEIVGNVAQGEAEALAGLKDGSLDPCAPIKCTVSGSELRPPTTP